MDTKRGVCYIAQRRRNVVITFHLQATAQSNTISGGTIIARPETARECSEGIKASTFVRGRCRIEAFISSERATARRKRCATRRGRGAQSHDRGAESEGQWEARPCRWRPNVAVGIRDDGTWG